MKTYKIYVNGYYAVTTTVDNWSVKELQDLGFTLIPTENEKEDK